MRVCLHGPSGEFETEDNTGLAPAEVWTYQHRVYHFAGTSDGVQHYREVPPVAPEPEPISWRNTDA